MDQSFNPASILPFLCLFVSSFGPLFILIFFFSVHMCVCSFVQALVSSLICLFVYSLLVYLLLVCYIVCFIDWLSYWLIDLLIDGFIEWLIDWLINGSIDRFILINWSIYIDRFISIDLYRSIDIETIDWLIDDIDQLINWTDRIDWLIFTTGSAGRHHS